MRHIFNLPDVGEGLTEAEIVRWFVDEGAHVEVNQPLCEIETAKALVELPSPYAGSVVGLHAEAGAVIAVGLPLVTLEIEDRAPGDGEPADGEPEQQRQPVLVGYGPGKQESGRRRHRRPSLSPQGTDEPEAGPPGEAAKPVRLGGLELGRSAEARFGSGAPSGAAASAPRTKPPVRRLARDLGVDLASVTPSGPGGLITRADVHRAAAQRGTPPGAAEADRPAADQPAAGDRVIPVQGVRRTMAAAMVRSAFSAPHVTVWLDVDVTATVDLLARLRQRSPGIAWTPTAVALAALRRAAVRYPGINATFEDGADGAGGVVIEHGDIRLGMAVATDRGLLVARVAGRTLAEITQSVTDVAERGRQGELAVGEVTGASITLTNVGVFGVDGGTPILPPRTVAILCLGRITPRPWVVAGELAVRHVATLTMSFDHRCVDGELGSRALTSIASFLSEPDLALAGL